MGSPEKIDEAGAERLTWSRADVCNALGISEQTFTTKSVELTRAGFPAKLPGMNAWSIAAVRDWVAHSGGGYTPFAERGAAPLVINGDPEIEGLVIALEDRYAPRPSATGRRQ